MHPKEVKVVIVLFIKSKKIKSGWLLCQRKKEIPRGTLVAILDQAGLTREDFFKVLKS